MQNDSTIDVRPPQQEARSATAWAPPRFEVIALDCEITAYAPDDGGDPLF
ncbi:MAG: hypothetical protein QNK04_03580 [Myxococcota bacterium]|nr:hypothetical protein [Myxococcota bacterium]